MPAPLFDTNTLLRHLTQDHPDHSPRATALIRRIESGATHVRVTDRVVFEAVFTLERSYRSRRADIRVAVLGFVRLPGVVMPGKTRWRTVFDLYVDHNISLTDAYHADLMHRLGIKEIISFDTDFDRVPGVIRVEP